MKFIVSVLIFVFSFGIATCGYTADSFVIESLRPQQTEYVNMVLEHTHGAKVLKTATVKSQNNAMAYYVGASFTVPEINEPLIAVWIISGPPNKPGNIWSVNDIAYQFSGMGKARPSNANASIADNEYKVLEKHLK